MFWGPIWVSAEVRRQRVLELLSRGHDLHHPPPRPDLARAVGPGCAWDSGLVFALGGGREQCQPCTHSLLCSGARERERVGGSSPGSQAWRLEQAGGLGPWMPHWDSSEGPVIYS